MTDRYSIHGSMFSCLRFNPLLELHPSSSKLAFGRTEERKDDLSQSLEGSRSLEQCNEHAYGQHSRTVAHAHRTQDESIDLQEDIARRRIEFGLAGSHLRSNQDMGPVELF